MVKVISLSNEAYEKLKLLKGTKSFSDVVIEYYPSIKPKKKIIDFFGVWKEDSEYWKKFKKDIRKSRDNAKIRGATI